MIKQISFVSIPVRDQNRALDFYTEKLGFTIITDQPFDEKQRWIELRVPKAETRVVLFTPEGDESRIGSFMNMSYACDDIDQTYEELTRRGVEFEGPPEKQPWGTYAMFKDSEGNRFVLSADKGAADASEKCDCGCAAPRFSVIGWWKAVAMRCISQTHRLPPTDDLLRPQLPLRAGSMSPRFPPGSFTYSASHFREGICVIRNRGNLWTEEAAEISVPNVCQESRAP